MVGLRAFVGAIRRQIRRAESNMTTARAGDAGAGHGRRKNEAFATRLASGLAENLGVSLRGVAEGVGGLGQKGVQAGEEAVKGVGGPLQQLFGGRKKR